MQLDNYPQEKLKTQIKQLIAKYVDLDNYQVIVFGSRVTGHSSPHSDIDIGILGPRPLPSQVIGQIKEEIQEMPILYKIDVVDFNSASPGFRQVALQNYEQL